MDGFVGLDLWPSLRRSLSSTNVVGCSISSSVETPLRRGVPDKHMGRKTVDLVYRRREVHLMAMGAMGRYSGAIHGSNARKSSSRRRPSRPQNEEEDYCEFESECQTISEAPAEDSEDLKNSGYASNDADTKIPVEKSCRNSFGVNAYVYDDIHGDFWPSNPYFQEMEALQGNEYVLRIDDVKNGAITNSKASVNVTNHASVESLRIHEDWIGNEKYKATFSDGSVIMVDGHGFDIYNGNDVTSSKINLKKYQILNLNRTKENFMVRETTNAERPADVLGSMESLNSTEIEARNSSGNTEQDSKISSFSYISEYKRDGTEINRDGGGAESIYGSGISENDITNNPELLSLQKKLAFFESLPEQQSALSPLNHQTVSEETSMAFLPVLAASTQDVPAGHYLPEESRGPILKLINEMTIEMQQVQDTPAELVEQSCSNMQELDNSSTVSMTETVSSLSSEIVQQVAEYVPEHIKEHVGQILNEVENIPSQVSQVAEQMMSTVVNQVTEALPDLVVEQVSLATEQIVEQVASHVVEPFASTASEITSFLSGDEDSDDSDDEFEAYRSSDAPEFKGLQGLDNFTVLQEDKGILPSLYNFYIYMLKKPLPEFVLGMFSAPVLLSVIFTLLYLPEFSGLALDETARQFSANSGRNLEEGQAGLQLSWMTVFYVFMFSVSLSTGLQPELSPLSPYTLMIANLNALIAQLIFVFLSGAVFARLSQPAQPVKCATVALVSCPPSFRKLRTENPYKVLMTRYVLVGPQPSELVDVKLDLTYKYNSVTRTGSYFRMTQTLKLVRPEVAYLTNGMLVRHIIDETSPLFSRNREMLLKEDAIFSLSVVGLERSSMQSVFYVQHFCVYDGDVIWDAEFEDMILINKKNRRVVDHSLLSKWKPMRSA